jgi:hypothetical protein
MKISIHQPDYIPYLGYFYKIYLSDKFVYLDDVQYSNDNLHDRNKIKTANGDLVLKIPVEHKFGDNLNVVKTRDNLGWKQKHLKTILMNYKKAPFFDEIYPKFEELLLKEYPSLSELNIALNDFFIEGFGLSAERIRSSSLSLSSAREEKVIDICTRLGGDEYISGHGASIYQVPEHFLEKGLKLTYTDYKPIEYPQLWKGFSPYMSVIDYVFNCGFDWDRVMSLVKEQN